MRRKRVGHPQAIGIIGSAMVDTRVDHRVEHAVAIAAAISGRLPSLARLTEAQRITALAILMIDFLPADDPASRSQRKVGRPRETRRDTEIEAIFKIAMNDVNPPTRKAVISELATKYGLRFERVEAILKKKTYRKYAEAIARDPGIDSEERKKIATRFR